MNAAQILDKEITDRLTHLNVQQKKTVLTVVKTFMAAQDDWWDEMGAAQQIAVDRALAEMKAGKLTPNDEVMKAYQKWMK